MRDLVMGIQEPKFVPADEMRDTLDKFVDEVEATGQHFLITLDGEVVAELAPYCAPTDSSQS